MSAHQVRESDQESVKEPERIEPIPLYSDEQGRLYRDKAMTEATDLQIVRTPRRGERVYRITTSGLIKHQTEHRTLRDLLAESSSERLQQLAATG
jgi:hypothetical protein